MPQADREWIEANLDRIERNGRFVLRLADALFRPFQEPGPRARFDVNRLLNEALQAARLAASDVAGASAELSDSRSARGGEQFAAGRHLSGTDHQCSEGDGGPAAEVAGAAHPGGTGRRPVPGSSSRSAIRAGASRRSRWPTCGTCSSQSADGLGFGLWWVRTFIERQGGTIACDSTAGCRADLYRAAAGLDVWPEESTQRLGQEAAEEAVCEAKS